MSFDGGLKGPLSHELNSSDQNLQRKCAELEYEVNILKSAQ